MIQVTNALKAAVRVSHEVAFRVLLTEPSGAQVADLTAALIGGSVSMDTSAGHQRRVSLTLSRTAVEEIGLQAGWWIPGSTRKNRYGNMLTPYDAGAARTYGDLAETGAPDPSPLSPSSGNELRIARGVVINSTVEWCPLGVFGLSSVRVSGRPENAELAVSGYDRSRRVGVAGWDAPRQLAGTSALHSQVATLVGERLTGVQHQTIVSSGVTSTAPVPVVLGANPGGNPWTDLVELLMTQGLTMGFDGNGDLVIHSAEPEGDPVWELNEGEAGVIIDREWEDSDDGVFNAVFATGSDGIVAQAIDLDPESPTYYFGPLGRRPLYIGAASVAGSAVDTAAAAQAFADLKLRQVLGTDMELTIETVPMPALEPGDRVRVATIDGIAMPMTVIGVTTPLDSSSSQSVIVRRVVN